MPVDKEPNSRYYSLNISARFKIISTHTRLPGRISTQATIAHGIEASQLSTSSGLQQYPQSEGRVVPYIAMV